MGGDVAFVECAARLSSKRPNITTRVKNTFETFFPLRLVNSFDERTSINKEEQEEEEEESASLESGNSHSTASRMQANIFATACSQ